MIIRVLLILVAHGPTIIPCNVKMGCHVIDKNQPIRLAEFGARGHAIGVPARTTYSEDPDVARDRTLPGEGKARFPFSWLSSRPSVINKG